MKKIMFLLFGLMATSLQISAMSYEQARNEALFLTDKMAYELNLTDAQYEAAYEINLDYLMAVAHRDHLFGPYWEHRNYDMRYVLHAWQWEAFCAAAYFYRPLIWEAGHWHFSVYARYPHRDYLYFGRPHFYASYRGGHGWRHNGGHSYYEHHHELYRPQDSQHHTGMRDGWNQGNYHSGRHTGRHSDSSTRITGSNHSKPNNGRTNNPNRGSVRENVGKTSSKVALPERVGRTSTRATTMRENVNRTSSRATMREKVNRTSSRATVMRGNVDRASGRSAMKSNMGQRNSGRRR